MAKFSKFKVWDKVQQREAPVVLEIAEFLYDGAQDGSKEAPEPKPSSIIFTASTEHRFVTDTRPEVAKVVFWGF